MHAYKNERKANRHKRKENQGHHVAGKHIGVQTDGQRQHPSQMADDLDRNHDDRQPPHRPNKLLQVGKSVTSEPLDLVIDEGADGTSEWNHGHGGRRLKSWNQANQVTDQDEAGEGD